MARFSPIKNSFVAGELSPRLEGRDDIDQYFQGNRQIENMIVLPHGGLSRRSGTRFVAEVKNSSNFTSLLDFEVSTDQAHVVEFGDLYARFYVNEGRLESPPLTPVEVVTPYLSSQVSTLKRAQEGDVMYVVNEDHPLQKLTRTTATSFTFGKVAFSGGKAPLQPENLDATLALTVSGAGPFTLTWSSDIGLTTLADVGRAVRHFNMGAGNAWYDITAVSSGSVATADLKSGTASLTAETDWALGLFSDTRGCRAITFHEGRLLLGGFLDGRDRWVASVSDDFENFDIVDDTLSSAENADRSISRRTVGKKTNTINWFSAAGENLFIGSGAGEFIARGANDDFLTPSGTRVSQVTSRGSSNVDALTVNSQIIFSQRNSRKLRELAVLQSENSTSFSSRDISIFSEHILRSGVSQLEYQQDPDSVIWAVRNDGIIVGFTFEPEQNVLGAHRHIMGGSFASGDTVVDSVAVIPTPDETEDTPWFIVKRTINGVTKRYVEFGERQFRPDIDSRSSKAARIAALDQAKFLDSHLTLNTPLGGGVTGITSASPPVVDTVSAHTLVNGDTLKLRDVVGLLGAAGDENMSLVNNKSFTAANVTATSFELAGEDFTAAAEVYATGGTVRKERLTVSGLGHLEGEQLDVLADGAVHPPVIVSDGAITLTRKASIIVAGLQFVSRFETQRFIGGGRIGTDQGQKSRMQRAVFRVHNTLGGRVGVGPIPRELEPLVSRTGSDPMDSSPPLQTGDIEVPVEGGWSDDPTAYGEQDQPIPFTVLSIMPRMASNER